MRRQKTDKRFNVEKDQLYDVINSHLHKIHSLSELGMHDHRIHTTALECEKEKDKYCTLEALVKVA